MTTVQHYQVVLSDWPSEDGYYRYTITDGVQSKGEFDTPEEAEENMESIISNWRCDS